MYVNLLAIYWMQRVKVVQLLLEMFVRDLTDHRNGLGLLVPEIFQPVPNECLERVMDNSTYFHMLI